MFKDAVYKAYKAQCYGCEINHPSQRQHDCLYPVPEYFYHSYLDRNYTQFHTDLCIPTIQRFLSKKGTSVEEARVRGATEAILHDMKTVEGFIENLMEVYDTKIEGDRDHL